RPALEPPSRPGYSGTTGCINGNTYPPSEGPAALGLGVGPTRSQQVSDALMSTIPTDLLKDANVVPISNKDENSREDSFDRERVLVIEPGGTERHYWRDLWRYRELFRVLAWRDISVRYKQTVIGAAWALIRPFLTMVVFTVIFGKLANFPSDGTAPY